MASRLHFSGARVLLLATLLSAPACGARSAIPGDGLGSGGSAGAPACTSLTFGDPKSDLLTPENGLDYYDVQLTASSDDGARLTALLTTPQNGAHAVSHVSLSPWQDWPSGGELSPIYATSIVTGSFPIGAPAMGDRFSIFTDDATDEVNGLNLYPDLDPNESGQGPSDTTISLSGDDVSFLVPPEGTPEAAAPVKYLVGSYYYPTQSATSVFGDGSTKDTVPIGCTTDNLASAGAVPFKMEWLVALAVDAASPTDCEGASPGPSNRIAVMDVTGYGGATLLTSIDVEGITEVHGAPHEKGMYLVWTVSHSGPDAVQIARYDATTDTLVGPINLAEDGELNLGVSIARVGSSLLVARGRLPASGAADAGMMLTLLDEDLNRLFEAPLVPTLPYGGPRALYGSPDGKGAVLGWVEQSSGVGRARLTRLDCSP
ncbi:MAG: hypothetical protein U0441_23800 [Polyangiaceae bacterium]